jgi:hypothetical protein
VQSGLSVIFLGLGRFGFYLVGTDRFFCFFTWPPVSVSEVVRDHGDDLSTIVCSGDSFSASVII